MDLVEVGEFAPIGQMALNNGTEVDHSFLTSHQVLALRMARMLGVDLVSMETRFYYPPVIVLGFGAGITMATCDHLKRNYPTMPLMAADLSGGMDIEKRCLAMDYLGNAFDSIWILWSSIRSATDILNFLRNRDYQSSKKTWLYLNGLGCEQRQDWLQIGCVLIDQLWDRKPLGDVVG